MVQMRNFKDKQMQFGRFLRGRSVSSSTVMYIPIPILLPPPITIPFAESFRRSVRPLLLPQQREIGRESHHWFSSSSLSTHPDLHLTIHSPQLRAYVRVAESDGVVEYERNGSSGSVVRFRCWSTDWSSQRLRLWQPAGRRRRPGSPQPRPSELSGHSS